MDKILIIDDDEELCELVSEYLTVEGFQTTAVNDGVAGLETAARASMIWRSWMSCSRK